MKNVTDGGIVKFCYKTEKERVLGKGAFGEVYRGRQISDNQVVAIKRIKSNQEQTKELQQFYNEITILNRLDHKNLIKIYFYQLTLNNSYIVMEYCSGGSLRNQLNKRNHYSEDEARHIFRQILAGYQQLYEKNIVHRDIKPENILLDSNQVIKITDFGTSKIMEDYSEAQMQTVVGTYQYMAPQVVQRNYTNKADVWSLGITFYEVLYGQPPWKVQDENQVQQLNLFQLDFPNQPVVSEEMKQIITKMLRFEEQDRMSCEELLNLKI